jgi:DedD protein
MTHRAAEDYTLSGAERRRPLLRAALALLAIAILLGALSLFEEQYEPADADLAALTAGAPAAGPGVAAPGVVDDVVAMPAGDPAAAGQDPAAAEPPVQVAELQPPAEPDSTLVGPTAPAAAPAAPVAAPEPPPDMLPTTDGKGYLVQLGVFGTLENAQRLQAQLVGLGVPARLESRVVLGPFADRATTREAQARLRAAGQDEGIVRPPRK